MKNDKEMVEFAIVSLMNAWNDYLDMLCILVQRTNNALLRDEKYFATADKKGKTQEQKYKRKRQMEEHERSFNEYTTMLEHYCKVNAYINQGIIKPYCIKSTDSFGVTLRVDAYYFIDMPDGTPGFFSTQTPNIVLKMKYF